MVHKYTSIKAVLSNIASTFPKDVWDEADALEWAAFALEKVRCHVNLDQAIAFLSVTNHRAKLPKGLVILNQAAYKSVRELTTEDLADLESELLIPTESYYAGFVGLTERFNYRPMRKATGTFSLQKACEDCDEMYPIGEPEYTLMANGCIHTSFSTGDVCISFMKYPMDENGDFLIPDHIDVIQAITYYVNTRIWEKRMNMKEEGARQMFEMYLGLFETAATKATGKLMMPDIDTLQNIKDQTDRFFPASNKYYSFFGNLNSPERPYMGGRWSRNLYLW
jgi:hypothetical protein